MQIKVPRNRLFFCDTDHASVLWLALAGIVQVLEARSQSGDGCGHCGWLSTFYSVEQRRAEIISCAAVATFRCGPIIRIYAFMVLVARELFGFDS
jgi:hypothetical protein